MKCLRHCERSEAIHARVRREMDCFVARAPRNDGETALFLGQHFKSGSKDPATRSEARHLEEWQLARPSPAAIRRDPSLARRSQDEIREDADTIRTSETHRGSVNQIKTDPLHCERSCSAVSNGSAVRIKGCMESIV